MLNVSFEKCIVYTDAPRKSYEIELWGNHIPMYNPDFQIKPVIEFYPSSVKNSGCVVVCPGGGYRRLAEHEGKPICEFLNANNINAALLHYRVSPYRFPASLIDARRAIRTLRHGSKQYGINPQKIAILGFSAGGHLTTMAGTHFDETFAEETGDEIDSFSARPDAVVSCYGVTGFKAFPHVSSIENLLGKRELTLKEAKYFSAEYNVSKETPPMFLWHTAEDSLVPVESSIRLACELINNGVSCSLHIFPNGHHGLGLAQDVPFVCNWKHLLLDWLHLMNY